MGFFHNQALKDPIKNSAAKAWQKQAETPRKVTSEEIPEAGSVERVLVEGFEVSLNRQPEADSKQQLQIPGRLQTRIDANIFACGRSRKMVSILAMIQKSGIGSVKW
uniref:Uncharacterized protein n=1 Tax=Populus alba TaxID=43335 RepID=A0A4U5Q530_POPAL|nr:hypothetical protein D5086_0000138980 [Populus alba]